MGAGPSVVRDIKPSDLKAGMLVAAREPRVGEVVHHAAELQPKPMPPKSLEAQPAASMLVPVREEQPQEETTRLKRMLEAAKETTDISKVSADGKKPLRF